jgi:hypothetical protein
MVLVHKRLKEKPPPTDKKILDALTMIKISGKSYRDVALLSGIPKKHFIATQNARKTLPTYHQTRK